MQVFAKLPMYAFFAFVAPAFGFLSQIFLLPQGAYRVSFRIHLSRSLANSIPTFFYPTL